MEQSDFSRIPHEKHQLLVDQRDPNRMILSLGEEDWPFPVRVPNGSGLRPTVLKMQPEYLPVFIFLALPAIQKLA